MNVPLNWLSEYVTLPDSIQDLTDRLTMIGHMLDKKLEVDGKPVIDLELRGNRADLFGFIGIARDISAAWDVPLLLPDTESLPIFDPKSKLITVEARELVPRFTAFTVKVTVGMSPDWMVKKLHAYGMQSINNVVDITNYVMLETGIPLHAFDKNKLIGKRLIVRRAKKNEQMTTFMGGTISLTSDDIVLADEKSPQAITLVGSNDSGTTENTKEILIEAAVYNQANVRRTSRRLGVRTEAGTRLEKHLDPNEVPFALSRALHLLKKYAKGEPTSKLADVYSNIRKQITIDLPKGEITRLSGITVPEKDQRNILERLGCTVKIEKNMLVVTVPTFRTDITETADLVEEITRIVGYETIPTHMLSGELPPDQTLERIKQEAVIKKILVQLQLNEVITSSFIHNTTVSSYSIHGALKEPVLLTNAPDPAIATLRPSLLPNIVDYAKRLLNERAERVALFEIGKMYWTSKQKKKNEYSEERTLGIVLSGSIDTKSYGKNLRSLTFFDLKGILEVFGEQNGLHLDFNAVQKESHPSLDPNQQIHITIKGADNKILSVGFLGKLDSSIQKSLGITSEIYLAELSLDTLLNIPAEPIKPYRLAPQYPPIIEDISFVVDSSIKAGEILTRIQSFHPTLAEVRLLDAFENKRTFRLVYQDSTKNLSSEEVRPIREKLVKTITKEFGVHLAG